MHAAVAFGLSTITASAESVDAPTPAARVTWNTTIPPECVASVTVNFRTGSHFGPVVANYTTNSTSQTEVMQTGLRCTTYYYITVNATGQELNGILPTVSSRPMRVFVGGNRLYDCVRFNWYSNWMVVVSLHRYTYSIWSES